MRQNSAKKERAKFYLNLERVKLYLSLKVSKSGWNCLELGRAPAQSPETSFKVATMSGTTATAILTSAQFEYNYEYNYEWHSAIASCEKSWSV